MGLTNGMTLWEDLFWASFQQYIKGWTKKILVWSKNGIANKWIETSVFGIGQFHRWCFSASPWKNPRTSTSVGGKIPIWLVICKRFGAILGPKLWSEFFPLRFYGDGADTIGLNTFELISMMSVAPHRSSSLKSRFVLLQPLLSHCLLCRG